MSDTDEPSWLSRLRPAANQRPRTQFIKVRRHDLEELLRERDSPWRAASDDTRTDLDLEAARREYGRSRVDRRDTRSKENVGPAEVSDRAVG